MLGLDWNEDGEPNPDCSTVPPAPPEKEPEDGDAAACPNKLPVLEAACWNRFPPLEGEAAPPPKMLPPLAADPPPKTEPDEAPKVLPWPKSEPPDWPNVGLAGAWPNTDWAGADVLEVGVPNAELVAGALAPPKRLPPEEAVEVGLQIAWPKKEAWVVAAGAAAAVGAAEVWPNSEPELPPNTEVVADPVDVVGGRAKLNGLEGVLVVDEAAAEDVVEMEGKANEKEDPVELAALVAVEPPNNDVVVPAAAEVAVAVAEPPNTDGTVPGAAEVAVAAVAAPPKIDVVEEAPPKREVPPNRGVELAPEAGAVLAAGAPPNRGVDVRVVAALLVVLLAAGVEAAADEAAGDPNRDVFPKAVADAPNREGVEAPPAEAAPPNRGAAVVVAVAGAGAELAGGGATDDVVTAGVAAAEVVARLTGELADCGAERGGEAAAAAAEAVDTRADSRLPKPKPAEAVAGAAAAPKSEPVVAAGVDILPKRGAAALVAAGALVAVAGDPKSDVFPAWKLVPEPPNMLEAGLLAAMGAPPSPIPPKNEVVVVEEAGAAEVVESAAAVTGVMVTAPPRMLWMEDTLGVGRRPWPGLEAAPVPTTMTGLGLELAAATLGADGPPTAGAGSAENEKEVVVLGVLATKGLAGDAGALVGAEAGAAPVLLTMALRADSESLLLGTAADTPPMPKDIDGDAGGAMKPEAAVELAVWARPNAGAAAAAAEGVLLRFSPRGAAAADGSAAPALGAPAGAVNLKPDEKPEGEDALAAATAAAAAAAAAEAGGWLVSTAGFPNRPARVGAAAEVAATAEVTVEVLGLL